MINILGNPVDLASQGRNVALLQDALKTILADPAIDLLLVQEDMGILMQYLTWENVVAINDILINLRGTQNKPVVAVLPSGLNEAQRRRIEHKLTQALIPVYPTLDRAATAIKNLNEYSLKTGVTSI